MGSSVSALKMSKVSGVFVSICLAALFTSGFALNCIQCNGTSTESTGICEKDEAGVSTTCLSTATACAYSNCTTPDGETMIIRACGDDEPPSKTETAPNFYYCQDYVPILDYNCTI